MNYLQPQWPPEWGKRSGILLTRAVCGLIAALCVLVAFYYLRSNNPFSELGRSMLTVGLLACAAIMTLGASLALDVRKRRPARLVETESVETKPIRLKSSTFYSKVLPGGFFFSGSIAGLGAVIRELQTERPRLISIILWGGLLAAGVIGLTLAVIAKKQDILISIDGITIGSEFIRWDESPTIVPAVVNMHRAIQVIAGSEADHKTAQVFPVRYGLDSLALLSTLNLLASNPDFRARFLESRKFAGESLSRRPLNNH
ncbi:hypothetical protein SAMN04489765_4369 [Tsukamurella pulmonis]|uniref:PH domain-containing protein n=1 Tax=Tsukamurella pulmonis TaxID=47312 RepID=A0A1H1HNE5_9ACTN|nr:hypothetical protein [Tsukamurella pulmonis]SDR26586.1 hypothetical protein SAMN04489765_4369 [Tsukamurella pulmonis]SUP13996.1 Uncharacterised protein [Tsukamurella pulmonis]